MLTFYKDELCICNQELDRDCLPFVNNEGIGDGWEFICEFLGSRKRPELLKM